MQTTKAIAYFRVSTERQGRSGLGLEAQREAVGRYLAAGDWTLAGEFVEIESGRNDERPQLAAALAACRLTGATLVIAKLDRLARNARFLLTILDGAAEGGVVFCDLPHVPAGAVGRFLVTQMAAVAELEAGLIAQRTRDALKAAKARGVKLGGFRGGPKVDSAAGRAAQAKQADGFAAGLAGIVVPLRESGASLRSIAAHLTEKGIKTARGGAWSADAVRDVLRRTDCGVRPAG
jgi:DNA invertase Pin-like site-specific DNA recombinase